VTAPYHEVVCNIVRAVKARRARRGAERKKTREEIEQIGAVVVDAFVKVHRALGAGLLESAYQVCLAHELRCRGLEVGCEVALPVKYGDIEVEVGL
jgi:hypothetical protein